MSSLPAEGRDVFLTDGVVRKTLGWFLCRFLRDDWGLWREMEFVVVAVVVFAVGFAGWVDGCGRGPRLASANIIPIGVVKRHRHRCVNTVRVSREADDTFDIACDLGAGIVPDEDQQYATG